MSDQFNNAHQQGPGRTGPGKRLEKKTKPVLTPAQAQKKREKRIMVIMIVAAVIMVLAAAAVTLYVRLFKKPTLPPPPGETNQAVESADPDADPSPEETLDFDAVQPKVGGARKSEDIFTFFVVGKDIASGSTDTMMVATYDVTNQKATVMSLPRDTLVNVRSGSIYTRLNAVSNLYGGNEKGREALLREVSELVGFTPDYYVEIDWELVGEMVDAIGGVWFDNPYHMEYYDPYQDLNIYQEKGYRKIDGNDAMQIVRWRHNGKVNGVVVPGGGDGSDLCRLRVQHDFLKAVLKQTLQIGNITRIGQLIDLFNSRVESNLLVENMFWFAKSAVLGGLQVDDVEFITMPYYGFLNTYVYPNQSELLTVINEKLNPFVEQVTIRQLDLISGNKDGSLRSSTGRLADPRAAVPPVKDTPEPEESEPVESGGPTESGQPAESEPLESGQPQPSGPAATEPQPSGTADTPPPAPPPPASQPPASQPPATAAVEPEPQPTPTSDAGPIDWGETTE